MAGTAVYTYPVAGATAPTAAQALLCNMVCATAQFADADTNVVITHNFKLTAAQLANLWPVVIATIVTAGTLAVNYSVALTDSSTVTIAKVSTSTGSGSTLNVQILRPYSQNT